MTETNEKILYRIADNKSVNEICEEFNLTKNQLKKRIQSIKNEGYRVDTMYSPKNNDRVYINFESYSLKKPSVKTCDIDNSILIGLVADTHIGSELSDMDSIRRVYEYFHKKDISFVFHLGDLVDGDLKEKLTSIDSQVLSAILDYPHDDSIRNFIIFGNHDQDFVEKSGIDVGGCLGFYRDDFISLGYTDSCIKLLNSKIKLIHKAITTDNSGCDLVIGGHTHKYIFSTNNNVPRIICPALSKVNNFHNYPGALTLKLDFDSNRISNLTLEHLMVLDNRVVNVGENSFQYVKKSK